MTALVVALPPVYAVDIMERIVTTQTQFIRHEATEYQRKVAEANARAYMAKQLHTYHQSATTEATPKPGKTGKTAKTEAPTPKGSSRIKRTKRRMSTR